MMQPEADRGTSPKKQRVKEMFSTSVQGPPTIEQGMRRQRRLHAVQTVSHIPSHIPGNQVLTPGVSREQARERVPWYVYEKTRADASWARVQVRHLGEQEEAVYLVSVFGTLAFAAPPNRYASPARTLQLSRSDFSC